MPTKTSNERPARRHLLHLKNRKMEIVIFILSAIILIGGFLANRKINVLQKEFDQKNNMVEELKVIQLEQRKKIGEMVIIESKYNETLSKWSAFLQEIKTLTFEAEEKKRELEQIAARYGMTKMDDGLLFNLVKDQHKMSRTLMANWLPYGMQLGKINLLETIKTALK